MEKREKENENKNILGKIVKNLSEPLLRNAIKQAVNILAKQFVFEKDIEKDIFETIKVTKEVPYVSFDENGDDLDIDYSKMLDVVRKSNYNGYIGIEQQSFIDNPGLDF